MQSTDVSVLTVAVVCAHSLGSRFDFGLGGGSSCFFDALNIFVLNPMPWLVSSTLVWFTVALGFEYHLYDEEALGARSHGSHRSRRSGRSHRSIQKPLHPSGVLAPEGPYAHQRVDRFPLPIIFIVSSHSEMKAT